MNTTAFAYTNPVGIDQTSLDECFGLEATTESRLPTFSCREPVSRSRFSFTESGSVLRDPLIQCDWLSAKNPFDMIGDRCETPFAYCAP